MNLQEADEQLLIERAQKDPSQFAEIYEANFERVYGFVAGRVRNRAEAEDVTAEVFHKALANLSRFEWRAVPFASWLFRIAANVIADRAYHAARERDMNNPGHAEEITEPAGPAGFEQMEERARLFRLVNLLPKRQRCVVISRFVEEKSIKQIAHEIGSSEAAVKQLQFRALENLRVWMTNRQGGSDA